VPVTLKKGRSIPANRLASAAVGADGLSAMNARGRASASARANGLTPKSSPAIACVVIAPN